ncbi:TPA: flagellar protein MotX [Photobacterium damselae]|uniref:Sodium-type polar flagellar protein MotX n=3 Tax=Photobacterium damselae TaxID=38293 RepID=D0Z0G5_PHODD|nr:tetratricopeptide repeat protein [Photobacterium damselae]AWK82921.1 flagellar protein MotX [Photobacterium damselae]EEZ41996.1 sodium-type polar flagellar protein MotX [Photobacterium damselae subsp. damselae CIP 102761]KAB1182071.1 sel1 repeat family protein [Photobacterium damselae subsp. damselae]KAB1521104.1 sel1 repeat family protein [Photobacterium damselae subsp. damselae]MBF7101273.1 sel1 repeat family protein [Photobacterium damselae]
MKPAVKLWLLSAAIIPIWGWSQGVGDAVPVYSDSQLIHLFETNSQLAQVKADDCQLVQDIIARARRVQSPAYQFLYGDMLAWGVCVPKDAETGLYYMKKAANQGLPAALEQLGRYYATGTLVQQDRDRAILYLREAAAMGNIAARIRLAELLLKDYGSPLDYEDAYRWLYFSVTDNRNQHQRITQLRRRLEHQMPANIIARAKREELLW